MKTTDNIKAVLYAKEDKDRPIVQSFLHLKDRGNLEKEYIEYQSQEEMNAALHELSVRGLSTREVVALTNFPGRIAQRCPGSNNMLCCNYSLLNTCFGCLYNCAYCFLNSYINFFGIRQFVNVENAADELMENSFFHTDGIIRRIGTGEFTDSLMFDETTNIAQSMIIRLAEAKNIALEFKTKSSNIGHLLNLRHGSNTVLAWSLNTDYAIRNYEEGTASLSERLAAAKQAAEAGYTVAFHFDPIIRYEGMETDYRDVVNRMFQAAPPSKVAWISLGCFRIGKGFKAAGMPAYEMLPCPDGKLRYLRSFRRGVYRAMNNLIKAHSSEPFVYLCMEDNEMWHDVFSNDYDSREALEAAMSANFAKRFL